ncbi:hypothetical protein F2Q70_00022060 [Brassica cretica]|uniref:Transmembrane protein n=1 Tax=Brassica cretica TaxID=69181 RepID=A0A8S9GN13_BRACR|nr:hypothetical protein F2Q70_00022060 [Brassica cretica]KAF2554975.1 hypothetical protein F2Q68_00015859 [Brassica cretica]
MCVTIGYAFLAIIFLGVWSKWVENVKWVWKGLEVEVIEVKYLLLVYIRSRVYLGNLGLNVFVRIVASSVWFGFKVVGCRRKLLFLLCLFSPLLPVFSALSLQYVGSSGGSSEGGLLDLHRDEIDLSVGSSSSVPASRHVQGETRESDFVVGEKSLMFQLDSVSGRGVVFCFHLNNGLAVILCCLCLTVPFSGTASSIGFVSAA